MRKYERPQIPSCQEERRAVYRTTDANGNRLCWPLICVNQSKYNCFPESTQHSGQL